MADQTNPPMGDASNNWAFEFNPSGIEPAKGKYTGTGVSVTKTGVYRLRVDSTESKKTDKWTGIIFRCSVVPGGLPGEGCSQDVLLSTIPFANDKDGSRMRASWKTAVLNIMTKDPALLEKGQPIKVGTGTKTSFDGKELWAYIKVPPPGTPDPKNPEYQKRPDANFMTPGEAAAEMKAEAELEAKRAAAGGAPAAGAAQTSTPAGTPVTPAAGAAPAGTNPLEDL